jgi:hypothetical protein
MTRKVRFNGKVYKPIKFGEGLQPGTVEWEMIQAQERAAERKAERDWKNRKPQPEPEPRLPAPVVGHPLLYLHPGKGCRNRNCRDDYFPRVALPHLHARG